MSEICRFQPTFQPTTLPTRATEARAQIAYLVSISPIHSFFSNLPVPPLRGVPPVSLAPSPLAFTVTGAVCHPHSTVISGVSQRPARVPPPVPPPYYPRATPVPPSVTSYHPRDMIVSQTCAPYRVPHCSHLPLRCGRPRRRQRRWGWPRKMRRRPQTNNYAGLHLVYKLKHGSCDHQGGNKEGAIN